MSISAVHYQPSKLWHTSYIEYDQSYSWSRACGNPEQNSPICPHQSHFSCWPQSVKKQHQTLKHPKTFSYTTSSLHASYTLGKQFTQNTERFPCYASRFTLNVSSKWYALGFLVYKDTSTSIRFRDKYTYWNLHQINKDYIVWQTLPVWTIAFNMLLIWKYTWQLKMMLTLCLEHTTS